jgi:hypothetical protein
MVFWRGNGYLIFIVSVVTLFASVSIVVLFLQFDIVEIGRWWFPIWFAMAGAGSYAVVRYGIKGEAPTFVDATTGKTVVMVTDSLYGVQAKRYPYIYLVLFLGASSYAIYTLAAGPAGG